MIKCVLVVLVVHQSRTFTEKRVTKDDGSEKYDFIQSGFLIRLLFVRFFFFGEGNH